MHISWWNVCNRIVFIKQLFSASLWYFMSGRVLNETYNKLVLESLGKFWPYCYRRYAFRKNFWRGSYSNYHFRIRKTLKITLNNYPPQTALIGNPRVFAQVSYFVATVLTGLKKLYGRILNLEWPHSNLVRRENAPSAAAWKINLN